MAGPEAWRSLRNDSSDAIKPRPWQAGAAAFLGGGAGGLALGPPRSGAFLGDQSPPTDHSLARREALGAQDVIPGDADAVPPAKRLDHHGVALGISTEA